VDPSSGSAAKTAFEVRAVDSRGGYARQVFSVAVTAPTRGRCSRRSPTARREGELLSLSFHAVDPEGSQ